LADKYTSLKRGKSRDQIDPLPGKAGSGGVSQIMAGCLNRQLLRSEGLRSDG
jgi:hypothetical protein